MGSVWATDINLWDYTVVKLCSDYNLNNSNIFKENKRFYLNYAECELFFISQEHGRTDSTQQLERSSECLL